MHKFTECPVILVKPVTCLLILSPLLPDVARFALLTSHVVEYFSREGTSSIYYLVKAYCWPGTKICKRSGVALAKQSKYFKDLY